MQRAAPATFARAKYLRTRGRLPNLREPQDLSEIVLSQILSDEVRLYTPYCDKYHVRSILTEWGLGEYLPQLYGYWRSVSDVPIADLPDDAIIKPTNGAGRSLAVWDLKGMPMVQAQQALDTAMQRATNIVCTEPQYAEIPCGYIAERWVGPTTQVPIDYKFMTCGGKIDGILVCTDRSTATRLSFFDPTWGPKPWIKEKYLPDHLPSRPPDLDIMIGLVECIAGHFDHVRVDLYAPPGDHPYLGELTFTPQAGYMTYFTDHAIRTMGINWPRTTYAA